MIFFRFLFFLLTIIFLDVACHNTEKTTSYPNFRRVTLQLVDSLGVVNVDVFKGYDTSFSWIHYSDCGKSCNEQKYRFQQKAFSINKESGFYWLSDRSLEIDQLTISHSGFYPFRDGDSAKDEVRHYHLKKQVLSEEPGSVLKYDTIKKIYDRYYSIVSIEKYDSLHYKALIAATTIRGNIIKFRYEIASLKQDSIFNEFIPDAMHSIEAIRISNGI